MTYQAFLLSVLAGVLGTIVYTAFVAKRQEQFRKSLARKAKGWQRKRYVKIFVDSIRGKSSVQNTKLSYDILKIYPVLTVFLCASLWGAASLHIVRTKTQKEKSQELLDQVLENERRHNQLLKDKEGILQSLKDHKTREDNDDGVGKDEHEIIEIGKSIQTNKKQLQDALSEMNELLGDMYYQRNIIVIITIFGCLWFQYISLVSKPDAVFSAEFSYELERFTLRIQGLASKAELAEIVKYEAKVVDEKSAIEYVEHIRIVAKRHNVEELVSTFLLWENVGESEG